jgi:hypothetical protein
LTNQLKPTELRLSRSQLTWFMLVLIFGPIGCGLLLSYFSKRMSEPLLPALVKLDTMWVVPRGDKNNQHLIPCISIKNPTQEDWKNLSVGLNEQFYCQEPKGIAAGETISLPLEAFIARNGSVRFPVGNRDIHRATVFAQIPTGERAVSEHALNDGKSSNDPKRGREAEWVPGITKAEFKAKKIGDSKLQ